MPRKTSGRMKKKQNKNRELLEWHKRHPSCNPNYKKVLCSSWSQTGMCKYGDKCAFAHGRNELSWYDGTPSNKCDEVNLLPLSPPESPVSLPEPPESPLEISTLEKIQYFYKNDYSLFEIPIEKVINGENYNNYNNTNEVEHYWFHPLKKL